MRRAVAVVALLAASCAPDPPAATPLPTTPPLVITEVIE